LNAVNDNSNYEFCQIKKSKFGKSKVFSIRVQRYRYELYSRPSKVNLFVRISDLKRRFNFLAA